MKISKLKLNDKNPRTISEEKMEKLKTSIKDFPKMMELRPIVYDKDMVVIGGNMRLRAIQLLGMTEIPDSWTRSADDLTEEEKREFTIKDNTNFGAWNMEELGNQYTVEELTAWGVEEVEYLKVDPIEERKEVKIFEKFQIIIECLNEKDQKIKYNFLQKNKIDCKLLNI